MILCFPFCSEISLVVPSCPLCQVFFLHFVSLNVHCPLNIRGTWGLLLGALFSLHFSLGMLVHSRASKQHICCATKKNEMMPLAATWMDLKSVILSEVSQTEKEKYHMISLICGIYKWTYLQNRETHRLRIWTYGCWEEGILREFGKVMYTLLYSKWITNKHMGLYSVLCGSLGGTGVWGRMDTCLCMAESLCCSPETTTISLISYTPIQNKKFKVWKEKAIYMLRTAQILNPTKPYLWALVPSWYPSSDLP